MTRLPTSHSIPIASLLTSPLPPLSLIYTSNSRWPLPPNVPPPSRIRISVLDSSFNPPHAAHKALAETTTSSTSDAQLLAFTISNADKRLDKEDLYNRLEMIRAMAVDLNRGQEEEVKEKGKGKWNNVAVAVLDAATFVKKSQVLKQEVSKLLREEYGESRIEPEFVFPVGWDTVTRIFAPRYYPPPGPSLSISMETFFLSNQSSLICARRGGETTRGGEEEEEREFLSSLEVDRWVRQGKLKVVDLNENENENDEEKGSSLKGISSTEIRKFVKVGNWDKVVEMVPFPSVVEIIKRQGLYK